MIILSLSLLVEPEYVAIRLKERTFNVRSVPAKLRSAYLMVALMFFAHPTVQLFERLAEDRLFSPLVSVIAFNPPAFDPDLVNLYGSPKYTRLIIGLSFAWLFCLSFGRPTLKSIEAIWLKPTRCTPAFLALAQMHRAHIEGWSADLFHIIDEHPDVSRFTAVQTSDLCANFGDLLDGFESILEEKVRFMVKVRTAFPDRQVYTAFPLLLIFGTPKSGQKLAIGGRLGVIAIALLTGLGAVLPYKNSPFVLGGAVVWAVWCCGRIILLEASPYQAVRAGLDLYGLLLASSLPAIFSVGIPIAVTGGHVLDANWAFAFEMTISTVTTFLLTDMTAPVFLKFGEAINLVEKIPDDLVRESRSVSRENTQEPLAPVLDKNNPPYQLQQTTTSAFVDIRSRTRVRQHQIKMEDPRLGGAPGRPLEAEPFELSFSSAEVE